jgi:hypothetical protein
MGVRLFLNICASHLKARSTHEGEGRMAITDYISPFGEYTSPHGTEVFPRFDYDYPSIIRQSNGFDCGLAVIANSMAFVKQLMNVKFTKSNMERHYERNIDGSSNEVCYLLPEKYYALTPFWRNIQKKTLEHYGGGVSRAQALLDYMRKEYIAIVDEMAKDSITDQNLFDEVCENIKDRIKPATLPDDNSEIETESDSTPPMIVKKMGTIEDDVDDRKPAAVKKKVQSPKARKRPSKEDKEAEKRASNESVDKEQNKKKQKRQLPLQRNKDGTQQSNGSATCHAGVLCRLDNEEDDVVLQGEGINGSLCCKCQKPFHKFCLFQFEDNVYCSSCFKEHVVSQCPVDTLFEELLLSEHNANEGDGPQHTDKDLVKYVNNFLRVHGLPMSMAEFC